MKTYRLSTAMERATSVVFVAIALAGFGLLLYSLRNRLGLMIICGIFIAMIAFLLITYVVNAMKAACIIDMTTKTMEVRGLANYTADLSTATLLQTIPQKGAQATIRVLVFSDAEDKIVAKVPTMFSFKSGLQAEPMAKEMAKELGIEFVDTVPLWEYDEKAAEQHRKEVAEQQKRETKERRKARMEQFTKNIKK